MQSIAHPLDRQWIAGGGLRSRALWLAAALAVTMAVTRMDHFGSAVSLPDASLAVFFLAGLALKTWWLFPVFMVEAAVIDWLALRGTGSEWCITAAYAFLVPTYACLWFAGRWLGSRSARGMRLWSLGACALVVAASAAFVVSNASFYALSGYFDDIGLATYSTAVVQYFNGYVGYAVMWTALLAGGHALLRPLFVRPHRHLFPPTGARRVI